MRSTVGTTSALLRFNEAFKNERYAYLEEDVGIGFIDTWDGALHLLSALTVSCTVQQGQVQSVVGNARSNRRTLLRGAWWTMC